MKKSLIAAVAVVLIVMPAFLPSLTAATASPPRKADAAFLYPIMFVGQVPIPADFTSIASTFGNHDANESVAPRGGDLFIRYPDGTVKNITRAAGFGNTGFQGANAIAVREPCVHWTGTKALFSMVVGAPAQQFEISTTYYWQIYEVTGLGENETPVVQKIANQPATFNNVSPVYGTDGRILFTSDRPRNGAAHLYPQLDEYEEAPTVTGIWSLNPLNGDLRLLNHTPSGAFTPSIDSFGRVIFTRWDHLQRDQQADSDADPQGIHYGTFDFSDEGAAAQKLNQRQEFFPEPRAAALPAGTNLTGNSFNQFFPWAMNEDGTSEETINHIGRHELHAYFNRVFTDDPALTEFISATSGRANTNEVENTFQLREDPLTPGLYYATDAPEFATHASGQLVSFSAPPAKTADLIQVNWLTPRATRDTHDLPAPADDTGHYRDPLPLSDGTLLAAHTAETREDTDIGTAGHPQSRYDFRLKTMVKQPDNFYIPGTPLTSGTPATIWYWSPDIRVDWTGTLWEMSPVEVRPRTVPAKLTTPLEAPELDMFAQAQVDPQQFRQYLTEHNLAVIVSRDVTTRDAADKQQPFNLHVPGGVSHTNGNGKIYDITKLQIYQADQLRGLGSDPDPVNPALVTGGKKGRRVLARQMHDAAAAAANPPATVTAQGGVQIATDGSIAAFVPANRALTWHMSDLNGTPVVRERYWLTMQPGEVRVCASCHGINSKSQSSQAPPTNSPIALRALLQFWKSQQAAVPSAPANFTATATSTTAVGLTWTASTGATGTTQYEVARASATSPFATITTTAAQSFNDVVSAGATYVYKVRAVDTSGQSPYSLPDVATTIFFTDDPLVAQVTAIKALHLTQLRQAVNSMRAAAGLSAMSFTDATPSNTLTIKAIHIQELRSAVAEARAAFGASTVTFSDSVLATQSTSVRAVHVQELRDAVK